jgi:hypothetical protein
LQEELEGLDLNDPEKTEFDKLICLGAYLGIHIGNRRDVILNISSKFESGSIVQRHFSEKPVSSTEGLGSFITLV